MLLSPRLKALTSLFKEVRAFKEGEAQKNLLFWRFLGKCNSCFSNLAFVKAIFEALKFLFQYSVCEASKLVSTKTLLLKHYYGVLDFLRSACSLRIALENA